MQFALKQGVATTVKGPSGAIYSFTKKDPVACGVPLDQAHLSSLPFLETVVEKPIVGEDLKKGKKKSF